MNSVLSILMSVLSVIAPCIVFGTCCYFLAKKNVVEAILMTIGSGIGILIHLFYILLPLWISSRNIPYTEVSKYYTLIGIIGALANICFAAGFLILVFNTVKKNTLFNDQFPKSID
ncbi:hypothetical protein J7E50_18755 [Pedobacter sp. ISL-68]|uniref:hypothetical protein n=1 Tax=unclassified Pedobacter TaxID=2628915 RepID=UPI001BE68AF7|nr:MULTISPECIES: hypothetical protein [unclassified Pedobacter]MBT2559963.1 hypothetical protein [Pedobacter sp. ISL-64]MBT2592268.1 hypothetical protein [Pedobacter sp. ISL-68]